MKNNNRFYKCLVGSSLVLAIAILVWLPGSVQAQQKGAEKLMKIQAVEDVQNIETGDTIVMFCPKCKETYAEVATDSHKAVTAGELKTVGTHLCSSCDTKLVTKGVGKQAKEELVHTCKACGSEDVSCCVMKKNSKSTSGMDDKK